MKQTQEEGVSSTAGQVARVPNGKMVIYTDGNDRNIAVKMDLQEIRGVKGEEVMMRRASKSERKKSRAICL